MEDNLTINKNETVFVEKYRPKSINDIVLPETMKNSLREWKENGEIPNLLLISKAPGLGKCLDYDEEIEIWVEDDVMSLYCLE